MPRIVPGGGGGTPAVNLHPTGCYYVNALTGSIQRQCNPISAATLAALGYMGQGWVPATPFNAFSTFADAQNAASQWANIRGGLSGGATGTGPNVSGGSSGDGGQTDWTHLFTRLAEFGIGAILVIIGLNAIVGRTKTGQSVQRIVVSGATKGAI
jgi:hypothetical protein